MANVIVTWTAMAAATLKIGVEPGELLVSASVEVTYALEQP